MTRHQFGIWLCVFVAIYATKAARLPGTNDLGILPVTSVSCRYEQYMIGNVPDPVNCAYFYMCRPSQPGTGDPDTMPERMHCGNNLYYDYRTCKCEYTIDGCYDRQPESEFFQCAEPYNQPDAQDN